LATLSLLLLAGGGVALWQGSRDHRLGSIVVTTNPSVEVFVDGEFKGRTRSGPLVLPEIPAGERRVTLRLGTRDWQSSGTVRREAPLVLSYAFPEARPSRGRAPDGAGRARGGQGPLRDVQEWLKGGLDKSR
jgi:hypothetical protein